ncbi:hypothetical protein [Mycobacterium sp.]|uniref:hypothetical protein n=1 Tax=Mycobacterium sp. TaxID=1785 RepID=UPI000CB0688B|nr:hypothetical protein [Mycobacterium sp.]PJE01734.1 MAG: hypothetical protein CK428_30855 [Mycobacterium sp.]
MTDPDPAAVERVSREDRSRKAHHEAGHAVAAVARGGRLISVHLGHVDWSTEDGSGDQPGETQHLTHRQNAPFVTFAGPWAQAMWTVDHDTDVDDVDEALEYAWFDNDDGDNTKYTDLTRQLEDVAGLIGLPLAGARPWEYGWTLELEQLWRAICEVAELLIDDRNPTHADVEAAIARCYDDPE